MGLISFGAYKDGPFGALYAFIGVGVGLLAMYLIFDCLHAVASFLQPRTVNYTTNNTLTVETAMKGTPTEDEMGAFLEAARQQGRIPRIVRR